ncbi:ABC transporter permease subunit [Streptomyces sp. NPDC008139]|uniref:ABC transporter permease n=1 Tax=Streptomyces sp. NPDC008139 TaxID=3364814 RepID=UPI0036E0A970
MVGDWSGAKIAALSLALALMVNRLRYAQAFFRSVFFLPAACSYVVAALIWKLSIFNGVRFGLANTVLGWFGADQTAWLSTTHPPWYWLVIVTVRLWLRAGFYMVLFLAGLQRIPAQLYEAAAVDGARPGWQVFRHITLPQLRATSVAVALLLVINAFQAFDETLRGLIIPTIFSASACFIFRQYFLGFPGELEDAAKVDGLGYWRTYWRIVVPNSRPVFAAVSAIVFIGAWNAFLWPLVVGQDTSSWTVQVALSTFTTAQVVNIHELFVAAAVSSLPLLLVFLLFQRHIVAGIERSGIDD